MVTFCLSISLVNPMVEMRSHPAEHLHKPITGKCLLPFFQIKTIVSSTVTCIILSKVLIEYGLRERRQRHKRSQWSTFNHQHDNHMRLNFRCCKLEAQEMEWVWLKCGYLGSRFPSLFFAQFYSITPWHILHGTLKFLCPWLQTSVLAQGRRALMEFCACVWHLVSINLT